MGEVKYPFPATSVIVKGYSHIIVFRNQSDFLGALKTSPHLEPLYGLTDDDKRAFPGLYVVGFIKDSNQ